MLYNKTADIAMKICKAPKVILKYVEIKVKHIIQNYKQYFRAFVTLSTTAP